MKKTITILALILSSLSLIAQSNMRINNWTESTYYLSPASVTDNCMAEFTMSGRKQWLNFPGSPTTLFATATTYIKKYKTQAGIKVTQDKAGYTSATDVDLTYAYAMWLNKEWRLHMGIAASFQSLSYDMSKVVLPTAYDPAAFTRLINESNFNSDLGVELASEQWRFGASSQNLLSLFNKTNNQFTNTNLIYGTYRQNTKNFINMGGGVLGVQYGNLYQMEVNVMTYFNASKETNKFQFGAFFRTRKEIGALFGIDLSNTLHLSYSYDYNIGGIGRSSVGTNEIMIIYRPRRNTGCIMCDY